MLFKLLVGKWTLRRLYCHGNGLHTVLDLLSLRNLIEPSTLFSLCSWSNHSEGKKNNNKKPLHVLRYMYKLLNRCKSAVMCTPQLQPNITVIIYEISDPRSTRSVVSMLWLSYIILIHAFIRLCCLLWPRRMTSRPVRTPKQRAEQLKSRWSLFSVRDACGRADSRQQIEIIMEQQQQSVSALQAQALKRKEKLKALRERQLQVSSVKITRLTDYIQHGASVRSLILCSVLAG